jgi:hypothetical protein
MMSCQKLIEIPVLNRILEASKMLTLSAVYGRLLLSEDWIHLVDNLNIEWGRPIRAVR